MPRDASGNYTTPAGQPVTSGTTISSTVFNALVNDLKTEMTDSLSRSGNGGMLVPLPFADGNVSAPGISFDNETNSGLYRAGAGDVRLAILGVDRHKWLATGETITGTLTVSGAVTLTTGVLTKANMPAVIQATSTGSGAFTHTGDTNYTAVTGGTTTPAITTTGTTRPILIRLQPSQGSLGRLGLQADAGAARTMSFKVLEDPSGAATNVFESSIEAPASTNLYIPGFSFLRVAAAGSHTWQLQVKVSDGAATAVVTEMILWAQEVV